MSFEKITKNYTPREEEVVIKLNGEEIKFIAKEVSYFKTQALGLKAMRDDGSFKELVVEAIFDQDGKRMSLEQAEALPKEYADIFLAAVLRVNKLDKVEEQAPKN